MKIFSAYLPIDRRRALLTDQSIPQSRVEGCALFVDISGFSNLTFQLQTDLGPKRGVEALTRHLNQIYEIIVDEIHQYRGAIIGFSGDAVTCWFEGDGEGLRAISASMRIQNRFQREGQIEVSSGKIIQISVKAAAAVGLARRFLVGLEEFNFQEVLAGSIVDEMSDAEQVADRSEVVLTEETMRRLGDRVLISEIRESGGKRFGVIERLNAPLAPTPWASDFLVDSDIARPWMLNPVYDRLSQGQGAYLAELRNVVSLFLSFQGIDYDDDSAPEKLHALTVWVQEILGRYAGYLTQLTMGDKGGYMLMVFGSPIAVENAAELAGRAALELRKRPTHLDFITGIQIGISQGRARAGAYGSSKRMTYGTLSHHVNMSARLMAMATSGQVIVSEAIWSDTELSFAYKPLGEHKLKGADEPQPLFQLVAPKYQVDFSKQTAQPGLIGRSAEVDTIEDALNRLANFDPENLRESRIIVIEGEAGIGKSKLLEKSISLARQRKVRSIFAAGTATARNTPYFVWRAALDGILQILTRRPVAKAEQRQILVDRLGEIDPTFSSLAPVLDEIGGFGFEETPESESLQGEIRANTLRRIFSALLSSITARRPIMLVLDDGHYFDSASWGLVRAVQQQVPNLLIMLASRPIAPPVPVEYTALKTAPSTDLLALNRMERDAILALVSTRLGVDQLPEPVETLILGKSEGNPYFAEELAYALRDGEFVKIESGRCELTTDVVQFKQLEFPNTVQDVIISRVDHLDARAQLAVKVASVIGRLFTYRLLQDVHPIEADRGELGQILSMLERIDITPLESNDPELTYIFKHIITHEVIYDLLLFGQKQALHQDIAEWYEETHEQDLEPHLGLLAYHWQQTPVTAKQIHYLERAGEQALRGYAGREAAAFFRDLLAIRPPDQVRDDDLEGRLQAGRWLRQLGEAYRQAGELSQGYDALSRAADVLGYPEPGKEGRLNRKTATEFLRQIVHRRAPRWSRRRQSEDPRILAEVSRVYYLLSLSYNYNAGVLEPVYALLHSLNSAEKARGDLDVNNELSRGYAGVGASYLVALKDKKTAELYFARAREIAESTNNRAAMAWSYLLDALVQLLAGYADEALAKSDQAIELYGQLNDHINVAQSRAIQSTVYSYRGEFETGLDVIRKVTQTGRQRNNPEVMATGYCRIGLYQAILGRAAEAIAALEEATAVIDTYDVVECRGMPEGQLAYVNLLSGNDEAAYKMAMRSIDLLDLIPPTLFGFSAAFSAVHTLLVLLEIDSDEIDRTVARTFLRRGIKYAGEAVRSKSPAALSHVLLYEGWEASINDQKRKGLRLLRKGEKMAVELDMTHEVALIRNRLSIDLPQSDPLKETYRQESLAQFEEMGAKLYQTIYNRIITA